MPTLESNKVRASLVCVGSELLRGKINTHASTVAVRLASIGIELAKETTVGDDAVALEEAIRGSISQFQVTIVTGGLGPTFDDPTREAAAAATRRSLSFSKVLMRRLVAKFRRARYKMPPANARQAMVVNGALPIENSVGTAPGQWIRLGSNDAPKVLILLPGPPSELHPMLEKFVLGRLATIFHVPAHAEAHLHFSGIPESVVDHRVRPIIETWAPAVDFTILAHLGLVDLDIFVSEKNQALARRRLLRLVDTVKKRVGPSFYGMDEDYPLEKVVGDHFRRQKATLAVAESCTGGMLAKHLTDIPGSSDYFLGGVVSYSNEVKISHLGVPRDLLKAHGAVSSDVALAMAKGVRARMQSTWGLSVTGIAGPGGGTASKPVGLVFIGLSGPNRSKAFRYQFRGSRDAIRQRTLVAALDLLRKI